MSGTVHAFDFLDAKTPEPCSPVCVLFGDEDFLKRLVKQRLRDSILGDDAAAPFTTFDGEDAEWCDVADEIATVSLFGGGRKRLVIVEDSGDDFVPKFRSKLEEYVEKPKSTGVLVLDVGTWASNTRLYKAVEKRWMQMDCRLPLKSGGKQMDEPRLVSWLVARTKLEHGATLVPAAAKLLIDLVGPQLGMLDQDLAKLSLFVGPKEKVTPELVQEVVGGWKAKTIWEVVDAAADGDAAEALRQLDMALQSGEHPLALFGQMAWSLRRYAVATRVFEEAERRGERMQLRDALQEAGFRPWPQQSLPNAERQIKQLGRDRAGKMLQWLLEADLAMKGSHSAPDRARFVLERLVLRMAKRGARLTAT
jgi:DNA polymerase-3 subunit delta